MKPTRQLDFAFLGRVPYPDALRLQIALRERVVSERDNDALLLLEHPPTVTLGRRGSHRDLRVPAAELGARGITLASTDRGGLATYHGPGQLVGYPIVDLKRLRTGIAAFVRIVAEALAEVAARHGVEAGWDEERPGLWVGDGKLAAVGFHVHRGVTTHGFALNVQPDLAAFDLVVPCGLADAQTVSLASLRGGQRPLAAVAAEVAAALATGLGREPRPVRPSELWERGRSESSSGGDV